jgi:hypothetical protein
MNSYHICITPIRLEIITDILKHTKVISICYSFLSLSKVASSSKFNDICFIDYLISDRNNGIIEFISNENI